MEKHRTGRIDASDTKQIAPPQQPRRPSRIRPLNGETDSKEGRLPLAACDCDNDTSDNDICVVGDEVEVNACGVWG